MDDTDAPIPSPTPAGPVFPADDFSVQLHFELDQANVPLSRLQAVQEGGVLPLQDRDGALPVRILAGSRAIATGQIVSIGDSYGVLVETILKEG
jgi:flagellar motor switch protein FliN/FliY